MSVKRQANILGQQRLDVPHLRAIESSISADFDLLAGTIMAGDKPLVVRGFEVVTSGAIGNPATSLQLSVAGAVVLHPLASEHGTIFSVPADKPVEVLSSTNSSVSGSFTANQVNYVGLDLRRVADPSTADLVMFLDANTLLETPKSVPLARVLQYRIVISTTDFASTPHLLPLAKVTTNNVNTVTVLEDARQMAFRLGAGGSQPDRYNTFTWPAGRAEPTTGAIFSGGDKAVGSFKDWMDAIMTRLWELGGGQYWYSGTSDREVKLLFGQPVIPATSDNFQWVLGTSTLTWSGLSVAFGNSPVASNTITAGSAVLLSGQCLYADINRSSVSAVVAHVGDLTTLGTPTIPGSRLVIAWRLGSYVYIKDKSYEVGRAMSVATTSVYGVVRLKYAAGTASDPVVLAQDINGSYSNIATGGNAAGFSGTGNGSGVGVIGNAAGNTGAGLRGVGFGTSSAVEGVAASSAAPAFRAVTGYADLPVIDRAGTIGIGTTDGTTVTIGRSGQVAVIQGTADIATLDRAGAIGIGATTGTALSLGRTGATTGVFGSTVTITGNSTISVDANGAAINLGGSTASAVAIGRSGITTTVNGTLDATTVDRAGAIAIGTANATAVTIGRVTVAPTFPGGLSSTDVTVSGAYKFAAVRTLHKIIPAADFSHVSGTATLTGGVGTSDWRSSGTDFSIVAHPDLPLGAVITGIEVEYFAASATASTIGVTATMRSYIPGGTTGSGGSVVTDLSIAIPGTSGGWVATDPVTARTLVDDAFFYIGIEVRNGLDAGANVRIISMRITYTTSTLDVSH